MANSNGWNDDPRAYSGDAYNRDLIRSVHRPDRDDDGSSGRYDRGVRSEGRSYARDDWRYGAERDYRGNDQSGEHTQYSAARRREAARGPGSRPVSDFAYGLGGGWDYELTGAYLPDEGRYDQGRYGNRAFDREGRLGPGSSDDFGRRQRWAETGSQEHRGRGPKDYVRSDERILEDVNDHLTEDPQLDASGVSVTVKSGEVTLAGTVQDRSDKRRAEDIADHVSGVRHVQNNLRVHDSNYNAATASAGGPAQAAPNAGGGVGRTTLS